MGRCKDFEEREVLRKALACFWEKGYEAASTRDLAQAMGISYGSVYNTFKDKRTLYLASLDFYICTFVKPIIERLHQATSAHTALQEILNQAMDDSINHPTGCFATNTILTWANQDDEVALKVSHMYASLETAIEDLLIRARKIGEIDAQADLPGLATLVVNTLFGIHLATRIGSSRDKLQRMIAVVLTLI